MSWWGRLLRRGEQETHLERELRFHIEERVGDFRRLGLGEEEAHRRVRQEFGGLEQVKEQCRDARGTRWLEDFWQDLRYGLRLIRTNARYSAVVVATLAICIGANTAVFSAVQTVLLRPLPLPDADQIVLMENRYPKAGASDTGWSSGPDYYDRMRYVSTLQDQALFGTAPLTFEGGEAPERIIGMRVTPSWFRLLRTAPALGRAFAENEGEIGNEYKVVLSHGLWQEGFGGDNKIIGREIRLSGRPYTVIGVMPRDFLFLNPEVRLWIPLALTPDQKQARHNNNWYNVGRLRPGATLQQVKSQVNALNAANDQQFPQFRAFIAGFETKVSPLKELLVRDVKGSLHFLWGGALLLLLIGGLNTGSLVIARTSVRTREMGTRLALGAKPGRVARQLITENLVLAFAGGLLGLILTFALVRGLKAAGLDSFPRSAEVRIDGTVGLFALAISMGTGLMIALLSWGYISHLSPGSALHEFGRTTTGGRRTGALRKCLVIAQVGLAFVLVAGATLMLMSFARLLHVQPGYRTDGVLTASTALSRSSYPSDVEIRSLLARSLDALRAIPGVTSVGVTSALPLGTSYVAGVILPEGYRMTPGEKTLSPIISLVTPGYFETMDIGLRSGRYFDERDNQNSLPSVIIDEKLAQQFWPGRDPVGKKMYQPSGSDMMKPQRWLTVAGMVSGVRMRDLAGTGNDAGVVYFPISPGQAPRIFTFTIRTRSDAARVAADVRAAMVRVDRTLALFDVKTMAERSALSLAVRRAALTLSLGFGAISLFLAAVGIYGVLSYLVAQRRREIGIRIAMGSGPGKVFGMFLKDGAVLVGIGLVAGVTAAFLMRGAVEKLLYGVRPLDPVVLAAVGALMGAVALFAVVWPAFRATKIDPAVALNEQ
jgi:predicted permease